MIMEALAYLVGIGNKQAQPIRLDNCWVLVNPSGQVVDLTAIDDKHRENPWQMTGNHCFNEPDSFLEYWKLYSRGKESVIFGQFSDKEIQFNAILDYHYPSPEGAAGNAVHRASLALESTVEWNEWKSTDGKQMTPQQFAQFIERHDDEFVSPTLEDMMTVAENLNVEQNVKFAAAGRSRDGRVQFTATEVVEDGSIKDGTTFKFPTQFKIKLAPYFGCAEVEINAHLRYRLASGNIAFWYELIRPHKVRKLTFDTVRDHLEETAAVKVLMGRQG